MDLSKPNPDAVFFNNALQASSKFNSKLNGIESFLGIEFPQRSAGVFRGRYREALGLILMNLLHYYPRPIIFQFNPSAFRKNQRVRTKAGFIIFEKIWHMLLDKQLVYISYKPRHSKNKFSTELSMTDNLAHLMVKRLDLKYTDSLMYLHEYIYNPKPLIILRKSTKSYDVEKGLESRSYEYFHFSRRGRLHRERIELLEKYNRFMWEYNNDNRGFYLDQEWMRKSGEQIYSDDLEIRQWARMVSAPFRTSLTCIFTPEDTEHNSNQMLPELGGRFYGGSYQSFGKEDRKHILFKGKETREVDYRAYHINLLYIKITGKPCSFYPYEIPSNKNPYSYFLKDALKRAFLIMVNCSNVRKFHSAFNSQDKPQEIKQYEIDNGYSNGKDRLSLALLKGIKKRHKEIYGYMFSVDPEMKKSLGIQKPETPIGLKLQFWDSEITASILNKFTDLGKPILPIHDSYLVLREDVALLKETMLEELSSYMLDDKEALKQYSDKLIKK